MKFNLKNSLISIFSSNQDVVDNKENNTPKKKRKIEFENDDFDKAISECDIPDSLIEIITDIVNKPLPDVILKTIDREAEKNEIRDSLREPFGNYIKYMLNKIEENEGTPLFVEGDDNVELVSELEEKLKLALQREEEYKNRYLSAERQKRALSDKVRDLEEKNIKLEKDFAKSEETRIDANNNLRAANKTQIQLKDSVEQLKLEIEHYKQLEINGNLMHLNEGFSESEFIESLKNKIIALETANGEMEDKLAANETHLKEVVESFETALHVKDETVMQAVEREKTLQVRIEQLQNKLEEESQLSAGGDEALTARLIDVTRKYQLLQSELSKYKNQIYEESEGELNKKIEQLNADLALAKSRIEELSGNDNRDDIASQMFSLREKIELGDKKCEELQNNLERANKIIETQNREIENLRRFPDTNELAVEELKNQITLLQVELRDKEEIICEANDKIEKLQIKRERVAENKKSAKQIIQLTSELEEANNRVEKFRKEAEIARLNVVALTNEIENLKNSNPQKEEPVINIEEDWLVVMEPETEEEIRERTKREREREENLENNNNTINIPFEDPAQMKLWD